MAVTIDGTTGVTTPDLTVDTSTLKVDAANNRVGVGNASPSDVLHIKRTDGTTVGNVLNIDNSAGSSTHGAVTNGIRVVSDNNGYWANLRVQGHSTLFDPQGSGTKVRIDADGLKFGTDTAAANALDDYEEGTFTPNVYHAGSNNSTFSTKTGEYTKIGNTVTCQIRIDHGNSGTAGSDLTLSGLPFTPAQAHSTMSIGIWGANPQAVGNIFGGSLPTMFKGGQNIQTQISFFTAMLVYKTS